MSGLCCWTKIVTCVRQDQDDRWLFGNVTLRWVFLFTKHGFQAVSPLIKSTAGERQEPAGSSNNRTRVGRAGKRITPMRKKDTHFRGQTQVVKCIESLTTPNSEEQQIYPRLQLYFLKNKILFFLCSMQAGDKHFCPYHIQPSIKFLHLLFCLALLPPPPPHFSNPHN